MKRILLLWEKPYDTEALLTAIARALAGRFTSGADAAMDGVPVPAAA